MDDKKGWKYHKSGKKIERVAKDMDLNIPGPKEK